MKNRSNEVPARDLRIGDKAKTPTGSLVEIIQLRMGKLISCYPTELLASTKNEQGEYVVYYARTLQKVR